MSKESMLKIKEAEDRAVALVEAARADARARVEAAEREGEALLRRTEEETAAELKAMLAEVRERTQNASERMLEDGKTEAETLRQEARLRQRSAEKIVIRGLESKCR